MIAIFEATLSPRHASSVDVAAIAVACLDFCDADSVQCSRGRTSPLWSACHWRAGAPVPARRSFRRARRPS